MKPMTMVLSALLAAGLALAPLAFAQQSNRLEPMKRVKYGQGGSSGWRPSAGDRAAFLDARIAGLKADLKLTPEQEKLWLPVETSLRENAAKREAGRAAFRREREQRGGPPDSIERMRRRADMQAERSAEINKIAAVSAPLYAVLNDTQKHRLDAFMHVDGPRRMGGREGWRPALLLQVQGGSDETN